VACPPRCSTGDEVQTLFERWIAALCRSGLNVVLVCHEQIDDSDEDLLRQPMIGSKKFPAKIMGLVEIIGYCAFVEGGTQRTARRPGPVHGAAGAAQRPACGRCDRACWGRLAS
jgi:hypothetical protein